MVNDLTKGKPVKMILSLCLPLMTGQIFQQLYNMVDSIIVGRFAGTAELSAVGSTGSLTFMVIGFLTGMCTGMSIPVSKAFGARDYARMRRLYANGTYITLLMSALLTTVTYLATRRVLVIMNTPDEIFEMAYTYISIIFLGLTATFFYNFFAGVMRALGDSKTPLYLLIFSSVTNIVLDLFFVIKLGMSVKGVAIATVISQAVSAVAAWVIIRIKFTVLRAEKGEARPDLHLWGELLYNGVPMALQVSVTAVGSIMLQSAVNKLGADVIAAVTVGGKIQLMLILPSETIGITMATYCGQNLGARRMDRVSEGLRKAVLIGMVYCIISISVAKLLGGSLALLFLDRSQSVIIEEVAQFLRTCSWFYPILAVLFIYRNSIQGLGYSVLAMLAGGFELAARAVMSFVVIPRFSYGAVCLANPSAWCAATVFLIPVWYAVFHTAKKKLASAGESPEK